jgi:hypothetical protein
MKQWQKMVVAGHSRLTDLLSNHGGPHTALLATPNGQLVSRATTDRSSLSAESEEKIRQAIVTVCWREKHEAMAKDGCCGSFMSTVQ